MSPLFFLACGLGFLWFWQEKSAFPGPRNLAAWTRGFFLRVPALYLVSALSWSAHFFLLRALPAGTPPFYPLFFLVAAASIQIIFGTGSLFVMTVFAVCLAHGAPSWSLVPALISMATMIAGIFAFAWLLLGTHRRLLYSSVPPALKWLPISFLGAFFLALAAGGFLGILP
ncbi:MAG TPA: hypothetical protein VL688_08100 [Verrucomicrobiae bacterium]|nr:hypothetical protein [Verrucomicrobiae bacterium]